MIISERGLVILTPTYNRAHTLPRLYESLLEQNHKELFQWLIVDDGSTDKTEVLVKEWKSKDEIKIVYLKKQNGGKHTAINYALENLPTSEYLFIVDSDDWLPIDCIDTLLTLNLPKDNNIAGVIALKADQNNIIMDPKFPSCKKPVSFSQLEISGFQGERSLLFKSRIISKYRFPIFEEEKFCTESILYDQIDNDGYKYLLVHKVLTICEYQEDGLSKNLRKLMINNPTCYGIYYYTRLLKESKIVRKLFLAIKFNVYKNLVEKKGLLSQYSNTYINVTYPIGFLISLYFKKKYKKSCPTK